jgi:hypothetical protein
VTATQIKGTQARIAIEAPPWVGFYREEVLPGFAAGMPRGGELSANSPRTGSRGRSLILYTLPSLGVGVVRMPPRSPGCPRDRRGERGVEAAGPPDRGGDAV